MGKFVQIIRLPPSNIISTCTTVHYCKLIMQIGSVFPEYLDYENWDKICPMFKMLILLLLSLVLRQPYTDPSGHMKM